jgi:hypothetical protein
MRAMCIEVVSGNGTRAKEDEGSLGGWSHSSGVRRLTRRASHDPRFTIPDFPIPNSRFPIPTDALFLVCSAAANRRAAGT